MNEGNVDFSRFQFDSTPYTNAVNSIAAQLKIIQAESDPNSKEALEQLDRQIAEKTEECSQVAAKVKEVRAKNIEMQTELEALKREEQLLTQKSFDLKEGKSFGQIHCIVGLYHDLFVISALKNACKVNVVEHNDEFRTLTQKLQASLGFKLKLQQCPDKQHIWSARFLFGESESDRSVNVLFDARDDSFTR